MDKHGDAVVIAIGKAKARPMKDHAPDDEEMDKSIDHDGADDDVDGADEDTLIDNAFAALKDDDGEGFRRSFKAAVEACVERAMSGDYDKPKEKY